MNFIHHPHKLMKGSQWYHYHLIRSQQVHCWWWCSNSV